MTQASEIVNRGAVLLNVGFLSIRLPLGTAQRNY